MNKPDHGSPVKLEPQPTRPAKSHAWIYVLIAVVLGVALYLILGTGKPKPPPVLPPTAISTYKVQRGEIPIYVEGLGSVVPVYTVTLSSQVNGQIKDVQYKQGQLVKKGDPLLDIEAAPFEASLKQAQGQLERDRALLKKDMVDLERYETAWRSNAIPEQQLADQRGQVHQDEGTVLYDEGMVSNAQVQVGWCHITSPIDGRVGLRLVDPGNVVSLATPLVVIAQMQPITVIFSVAQQFLPEIQEQFDQGHAMTVEAYDQWDKLKLETGTFEAMDSMVDTNTGSIRMRAMFTNANNRLYPNQFVNAHLRVRTIEGATLVPDVDIQRNGTEVFVYKVENQGTNQIVVQTPVKVGASVTMDDNTTNEVEGIEPGELLAADNFNRLQDKAPVVVRTAGQEGAGRMGQPGAQGGGEHKKGKKQQAEQGQ